MDESAPGHRGGPPEPAEQQPSEPTRRSFFLWLTAVGTSAVGLLLAVPLVRYTLYPVFARSAPATWSKLGPRGRIAAVTTPVLQDVHITQVDGWRESTSTKSVYVTRGSRPGSLDGVEVLSAVCPHLGCEIPWDEAQGRFICPCHGSVFGPDGSLLQGPAPRGMDTLPIRVEQDEVQVEYEYFQALIAQKVKVS